MDKFNNIDVNKLTQEAEAGHGHFVRAALDEVSFEEKLRMAHEIVTRNKNNVKAIGYPQIEFFTQNCCADADSVNGYSNIQLYRRMPRGDWGPFFTKEELFYEDSLNLTTGEQKVTDRDL